MPTGKRHRIAVIMGDGIGREVVPEGRRCWMPPERGSASSSSGSRSPGVANITTPGRDDAENGLEILKSMKRSSSARSVTPGSRTTCRCGGCSSPCEGVLSST